MTRSQIVLAAMTDEECEEFIREDVADYAEMLASESTCSVTEAAERAQRELGPRVREEHASAVANGHRRWTAIDAKGSSVGWLWVTPPEVGSPQKGAFLYQITVKPQRRRQGHATAMLAALEELLAADGIEELRLNVSNSNERALGLYEGAGYTFVELLDDKSQLRKRLTGRTSGTA